MNSERNIKRRILKLYPVKLLKDAFMVTGSQTDMISEIVATSTLPQVHTFSLSNINTAKQHVYFFDITPVFVESAGFIDNFPIPVISSKRQDGEYIISCMPIVDFKADVKNTDGEYSSVEMKFPQPIVISITNTHVIVRAVIMEKSLVSYLDSPTSQAFNIRKSVTDDYISIITDYFRTAYQISNCDLNAGLKHLVDVDIIDFRFLKMLRSGSVTTETMHEGKTFKQEYPLEYERAMRNPLEKSVFKYLVDDDILCSHFSADACIGKLIVSLFPTSPNQVDNVIRQILANN